MLLFGAEKSEEIIEVLFENNAYALSCLSSADIIILVIIAVVSFQTPRSFWIEQIFDIKVTDKLVGVELFVAIAKVAVEQQTIIEQSA